MGFKEDFQKTQQNSLIRDIISSLSNENLEKLIRLIDSKNLQKELKKVSLPEINFHITPIEHYAIYAKYSQ